MEETLKYHHTNKHQSSIWAQKYYILQSSESVGRKAYNIWFEQKEFHCKKKKEKKRWKMTVETGQIGFNEF